MKSFQHAVVLLLLAALLLPLVTACGPQATPTSSPPTQAPASAALPAASPVPAATATAAPTPPPAAFEEDACPFDLPAGQVEGETVDCGYLVVPEDRSAPQGPSIRLAVAVFHPGANPEPDPIVYLSGGPGGSALELIQYTFAELFEPILKANRDLVVFDQRGVGLSQPALDCPGLRALGLELLDEEIDGRPVSEEEALTMVRDAALECRQDLSAVAELSAYHTEASAADVEDLRLALYNGPVNLWGTSYGTWLALEVMRRYPVGIRSIVLDSVYPPDKDLLAEAPTNAARSIDLLFDTCAADEACRTAFPDLEATYRDTVERLNQEPARFQVTNPLTRDTYDVVMTGDNLATFLFQFLYATSVIPSLPQILYDASQGNYTVVAQLMGSLLAQGDAGSSGQQTSVLCHDEIAFGSEERFAEALADHPELKRAFSDSILGELGVEMCEDWQVGRADALLTQPVTSDLPVLVMSGEFDPITPPAWGRHVAGTLPNGFFFEYPGVGHGASTVAGCPQDMMLAFLADPGSVPEGACIEGMVDWSFALPVAANAVELVPFTSATFGIQGLVPEGWQEQAQPGVYARGSSATDAVVLIQQAATTNASELFGLLTQQLGTVPAGAGQQEANGLTWDLYAAEVQGLSVDLALADGGGQAMVVLMQCYPQERATLYGAVFLPVVQALVPVQ
ncbi:MAG TPA: alpha/beta hydrolase [Anaerolineae bacterium]|nr:alpha/beta hydrolase [Anaerolineae bacterium]